MTYADFGYFLILCYLALGLITSAHVVTLRHDGTWRTYLKQWRLVLMTVAFWPRDVFEKRQ